MPASIAPGPDGKLLLRSSGDADLEIKEEPYDIVILSVGMRPVGGATPLASALGLKTDETGFVRTDESLEASGIYVCGAVSEPMDIEEAAVRAIAAAAKIAAPKEEGR
jgi:heterodisulfide reductase subunit A-like polyferredoxin